MTARDLAHQSLFEFGIEGCFPDSNEGPRRSASPTHHLAREQSTRSQDPRG